MLLVSLLRRRRLVDSVGLAHGTLDVKGTNVLPSLLQQGNEEVYGQLNVHQQVINRQSNVSNGNSKAEHLLQLKLNSAFKFVDLGFNIVGVGKEDGELADLVESRSQKTRNLPVDGFRSKESIVFLGQLVNKFLVPVDLLQIINSKEVEVLLLGIIAVLLVSKNTNSESGLGGMGKSYRTTETLVLLGIIILNSHLELKCRSNSQKLQ